MIRLAFPFRTQVTRLQIIAFEDIRPRAEVHLQVVPKRHIVSCGAVQPSNLDLSTRSRIVWCPGAQAQTVKSMLRVGKELVQKRGAASPTKARYGVLHLIAATSDFRVCP